MLYQNKVLESYVALNKYNPAILEWIYFEQIRLPRLRTAKTLQKIAYSNSYITSKELRLQLHKAMINNIRWMNNTLVYIQSGHLHLLN